MSAGSRRDHRRESGDDENLSDYSDIADVEDELAANVKTEAAQDEVMDEDLYDHCICDQ